MDANRPQGGWVKSDVTLFEILDGLLELDGAGVTELAEYSGKSKSAVHKHLKTLEEHQYVVNEGGVYRLGYKFLTYGGYIRDNSPVFHTLVQSIEELSLEIDHACGFVVEEHDRGIFVYLANDNFNLRKQRPLGTEFYLHENASGKAILAEFPDQRVHEIIERHGLPAKTDNTVTEEADLFDRLETIRDRGFALNIEERRIGMNAIAVAVKDPRTDFVGALHVAGPAKQLSKEDLEENYGDTLLGLVNELDLKFRYG